MQLSTSLRTLKFSSLLFILFSLLNSYKTNAQELPFQYNKLEINLKADFVCYGQNPRATKQAVKLELLRKFLELNKNDKSYILLDYPTSLNKYITNNPLKFEASAIEKELNKYYYSSSYIDLQIQKIKELSELLMEFPMSQLICVGADTNSKNYDSVIYQNIKKIIHSDNKKIFFITSPQNAVKYYYPDENFFGNKFTSLAMLSTDTLFHNKTIVSIAELSKTIPKKDDNGLLNTIAYVGLRNYQRDRIHLIPYKNQEYLCINLWDYLAENNLTYDYLILFNEQKLNK